MSRLDKWNQRYADAQMPASPCALLVERAALLPNSGEALDLACGLGGNAVWLAKRGLRCTAWDNAETAILRLSDFAADNGLDIHTAVRDVTQQPPEPLSLDLIVVSFFLHRSILPALSAALRPGGLLCYQTFVRHDQATAGPNNPDFVLNKGELPSQFAELELRYYRESLQSSGSALAQYIGCKRG